MQNRYNRKNRRKCNLKVHIILVIKYILEYDATERICDIISIIKQRTTHWLWVRYKDVLSKQYWKKHIFWSDGYFACSIGEVSSTTIEQYIAEQG